jgi:hypothetical protein
MKHAYKVQIKQLAKQQFQTVTQFLVFGKNVISFVEMLIVALSRAGVVILGVNVKLVKMRILVLTNKGLGMMQILVMVLPVHKCIVVTMSLAHHTVVLKC